MEQIHEQIIALELLLKRCSISDGDSVQSSIRSFETKETPPKMSGFFTKSLRRLSEPQVPQVSVEKKGRFIITRTRSSYYTPPPTTPTTDSRFIFD
jgi:hypothetical protein